MTRSKAIQVGLFLVLASLALVAIAACGAAPAEPQVKRLWLKLKRKWSKK